MRMAGMIKLTAQDCVAIVVTDRPPVNAEFGFRQELSATFDALTDHCERSEAISLRATACRRLLRFARNDRGLRSQ
jgi:hypothetical protein